MLTQIHTVLQIGFPTSVTKTSLGDISSLGFDDLRDAAAMVFRKTVKSGLVHGYLRGCGLTLYTISTPARYTPKEICVVWALCRIKYAIRSASRK